MEQQQIYDFLNDNPKLHHQFIKNIENEIQKSQIALNYVKMKYQNTKKKECDQILDIYRSLTKGDLNIHKLKIKKMKLQIFNEQKKIKQLLNELNKILYETEKKKKILFDELLKREFILLDSLEGETQLLPPRF